MLSTGLLDIVLTGDLLTEAPIDLETSNWFQCHILSNTNLEQIWNIFYFPFLMLTEQVYCIVNKRL